MTATVGWQYHPPGRRRRQETSEEWLGWLKGWWRRPGQGDGCGVDGKGRIWATYGRKGLRVRCGGGYCGKRRIKNNFWVCRVTEPRGFRSRAEEAVEGQVGG